MNNITSWHAADTGALAIDSTALVPFLSENQNELLFKEIFDTIFERYGPVFLKIGKAVSKISFSHYTFSKDVGHPFSWEFIAEGRLEGPQSINLSFKCSGYVIDDGKIGLQKLDVTPEIR